MARKINLIFDGMQFSHIEDADSGERLDELGTWIELEDSLRALQIMVTDRYGSSGGSRDRHPSVVVTESSPGNIQVETSYLGFAVESAFGTRTPEEETALAQRYYKVIKTESDPAPEEPVTNVLQFPQQAPREAKF